MGVNFRIWETTHDVMGSFLEPGIQIGIFVAFSFLLLCSLKIIFI